MSDLNGDGKPDLVGFNAAGQLSVLLANSNGNFTGQVYTVAPPADTITGTSGNDSITLSKDGDGTDIDWTMGGSSGMLPITDAGGLTINGNGGSDTIALVFSNGNPLPSTLHLNGTFTMNDPSGPNLMANTTIEIGRSTVYITYTSASGPIALIQQYLRNGYNNGAWNGTPTFTGVITSTAAAQNARQTTGIGYADSADGLIPGQPANTIELKYTLYGDTGLSGSVSFSEFTRLTQHYNQTTGGTWDTGDFNYDGSVNFTDFTLMTRTYNTNLGSAGSTSSQQASSPQAGSQATPATQPAGPSANVPSSSNQMAFNRRRHHGKRNRLTRG